MKRWFKGLAMGLVCLSMSGNIYADEIQITDIKDVEKYDGYTYASGNGQPRYALQMDNDTFTLVCYGSKDAKAQEEVYTLDLDSANFDEDTIIIHKVAKEDGQDVSDSFSKLEFEFESFEVTMEVERTDGSAAGIKDGSYSFINPDASIQDYMDYDGYTYVSEDGQTEYALKIGKKSLKLRCIFPNTDEEIVYKLDVKSAVFDGDTIRIKKVVDEKGENISDSFKKLTLDFDEDEVTMKVKRNKNKLRNDASDSITTGKYEMKP